MKLLSLFLIFVLSTSANCFAQDSVYYKPAFNNSGNGLKVELNKIIKGHKQFPYTSTSTDVWDILKETDRDPFDSNNVILIYSNRSVNAAQEYNSGSGWSREHVWAKSRGDFGTDEGAGTDVHHLRHCDVSVNSTRNNRNFDECKSCDDVIDNGFNTGSKKDANLWTFEPPDNVKGDVARMIFYMTVRYEGGGSEPDLELTNVLLDNTDKSSLQGVKTTLLSWNKIDPVSDWERNRNEIIYTDYQNNRNPFIDYPELAEYLWGDSLGYVWKPSPTSLIESFFNSEYKVYPNPTTGKLTIEGDYDSLRVFNSSGQEVQILNPFEIDISGFQTGVYKIFVFRKSGLIERFRISKE